MGEIQAVFAVLLCIENTDKKEKSFIKSTDANIRLKKKKKKKQTVTILLLEIKDCRKGSLNLKNLTAITDVNRHYSISISYINFLYPGFLFIPANSWSKQRKDLQLSFKKLQFKLEHWLFPLQFPIISDVCTRFYIPAKLVLLRMTQIDPFILINSMKFLAGNSQEHSG